MTGNIGAVLTKTKRGHNYSFTAWRRAGKFSQWLSCKTFKLDSSSTCCDQRWNIMLEIGIFLNLCTISCVIYWNNWVFPELTFHLFAGVADLPIRSRAYWLADSPVICIHGCSKCQEYFELSSRKFPWGSVSRTTFCLLGFENVSVLNYITPKYVVILNDQNSSSLVINCSF